MTQHGKPCAPWVFLGMIVIVGDWIAHGKVFPLKEFPHIKHIRHLKDWHSEAARSDVLVLGFVPVVLHGTGDDISEANVDFPFAGLDVDAYNTLSEMEVAAAAVETLGNSATIAVTSCHEAPRRNRQPHHSHLSSDGDTNSHTDHAHSEEIHDLDHKHHHQDHHDTHNHEDHYLRQNQHDNDEGHVMMLHWTGLCQRFGINLTSKNPTAGGRAIILRLWDDDGIEHSFTKRMHEPHNAVITGGRLLQFINTFQVPAFTEITTLQELSQFLIPNTQRSNGKLDFDYAAGTIGSQCHVVIEIIEEDHEPFIAEISRARSPEFDTIRFGVIACTVFDQLSPTESREPCTPGVAVMDCAKPFTIMDISGCVQEDAPSKREMYTRDESERDSLHTPCQWGVTTEWIARSFDNPTTRHGDETASRVSLFLFNWLRARVFVPPVVLLHGNTAKRTEMIQQVLQYDVPVAMVYANIVENDNTAVKGRGTVVISEIQHFARTNSFLPQGECIACEAAHKTDMDDTIDANERHQQCQTVCQRKLIYCLVLRWIVHVNDTLTSYGVDKEAKPVRKNDDKQIKTQSESLGIDIHDFKHGLLFNGPTGVLDIMYESLTSWSDELEAFVQGYLSDTIQPNYWAAIGTQLPLPCLAECTETRAPPRHVADAPADNAKKTENIMSDIMKGSQYSVLPSYADVVIVGAGPAGLGMAAALQAAGINDVVILEKGSRIGDTIAQWPRDMRMITPSFYGNPYLAVDLNAVTPHSSPQFLTGEEHLLPSDYIHYLELLTDTLDLHVHLSSPVVNISSATKKLYLKENHHHHHHACCDHHVHDSGTHSHTHHACCDHHVHDSDTHSHTHQDSHTHTKDCAHGVVYSGYSIDIGEQDCNANYPCRTRHTLFSRFVIWAGGISQSPILPTALSGVHYGRHVKDTPSLVLPVPLFRDRVNSIVIVGGGESGLDLAIRYTESQMGIPILVVVCDGNAPWGTIMYSNGNVSHIRGGTVSSFTRKRLLGALRTGHLELHNSHATVIERYVRANHTTYRVKTTAGNMFLTSMRPFLATGTTGHTNVTVQLFDWKTLSIKSVAKLTPLDESTIAPGLFLAGPGVSHTTTERSTGSTGNENSMLDAIFKYRTRFAIVARAIAERIGIAHERGLNDYRLHGMFLDTLHYSPRG